MPRRNGTFTSVSRCSTLRDLWIIRTFLLNFLPAAALLPFGSGSAPAGKGVITEMCPSSQRADALNALTLVENVARLSTRGLFGFLFATFASKGVAYLTFFCNAVSFVHATTLCPLSFSAKVKGKITTIKKRTIKS